MNFAIVGATGNVGRKTIEILEKSKLRIDNLFLIASKKSTGKKGLGKGVVMAPDSFYWLLFFQTLGLNFSK